MHAMPMKAAAMVKGTGNILELDRAWLSCWSVVVALVVLLVVLVVLGVTGA